MDQPFDSDVMDDLAAESPYSPSLEQDVWTDEFDAGAFEDVEEFEDDADLNHLDESAAGEEDTYSQDDRFGDAFEDELSHEFDEATHQATIPQSWDAVVAEALSASTLPRFLQRLLRGARQLALTRMAEPQPHKSRPMRRPLRHTNSRYSGARTVTAERNGSAQATNLTNDATVQAIAPFLNQLLAEHPTDNNQALNQVVDWAKTVDSIDAASPVIAGLALRVAIPHVAQFPQSLRLQLVQTTSRSIADLTRQHDIHSVRAIAPILQSVQKVARQRHLPNRELALAILRTARQVATNAELVDRLANSKQTTPTNTQRTATVQRIQTHGGLQRLVIDGPVEIIIRSL